MESPKYDFHIHTLYLGCANKTMVVEDIIRECERLGVTSLGITDHLNNLDQLKLHEPIKKDLESIESDIKIYFGVELNYTGCDEEFAYGEEVRDSMGFQFAIGGIHGAYMEEYNAKKLVEIQHRHHLKTCENPLVDVLVHPYWFHKKAFTDKNWPWLETMSIVPESYARELGQVAKETGTAVEINADAILDSPHYSEQFVKEYIDYLAVIAEEGATFSVGSDAHDISRLAPITTAWEAVERLGIADRIYHPDGEPFVGGNAS